MNSVPSCYQEVKLENGDRVIQIKNLKQKDWMAICTRLELRVEYGNGKGSHVAVYKNNGCSVTDRACCVLTIPCNIYANFQRDMVKKLVLHGVQSGEYTEEDFWKATGKF